MIKRFILYTYDYTVWDQRKESHHQQSVGITVEAESNVVVAGKITWQLGLILTCTAPTSHKDHDLCCCIAIPSF